MEDRRELYEIGAYDEAKGAFYRDMQGHNPDSSRSPNINYFDLAYDYGADNSFYASKTFAFGNGQSPEKRVLWGWSPETRASEMSKKAQQIKSSGKLLVFCCVACVVLNCDWFRW